MAEDSDSETLENVTSNFKKDLECPICLDVVKQPFKLCERGHLMCADCLNHLTACPTCQGVLLLENPVCIKNLLEHLPHGCRHSANGCKKIIEDGNDHEKFCGFRRVECRFPSCEEEIIAKELLEHYESAHPSQYIIKEEKSGMSWPEFDPLEQRENSNLVHLFDNFFWFTLKNIKEEKQLKVMFEAIHIGKVEGDYYLNVNFINGDFDFRSTLKAYIPEEIEGSDQEANVESKRINYHCMSVPQIMLSHFIDTDGDLEVSDLFFFKG